VEGTRDRLFTQMRLLAPVWGMVKGRFNHAEYVLHEITTSRQQYALPATVILAIVAVGLPTSMLLIWLGRGTSIRVKMYLLKLSSG